MELTYDDYRNVLDIKQISASSIRFTLPPRGSEISDINLMLKPLLPDYAKVNIPIDEFR